MSGRTSTAMTGYCRLGSLLISAMIARSITVNR